MRIFLEREQVNVAIDALEFFVSRINHDTSSSYPSTLAMSKIVRRQINEIVASLRRQLGEP